jgi:hypothetical protein
MAAKPSMNPLLHEQPPTVPERVAVGLLDSRPDRRPDVREEKVRTDVTRQLAQVLVVPGRLDAAEHPRDRAGVIPADAEPVAVGRLGPEPRMQALVDQRLDRGVQHLRKQDRRARVSQPAAHASLLISRGPPRRAARSSRLPSASIRTARPPP